MCPFYNNENALQSLRSCQYERVFKMIHDGEAGKLKDSRTKYNFDLLKRETKEPAACC